MNAKYLGKQIKRNEFGDVTDLFNPCVVISYKERESALAEKVIAHIEKETGIDSPSAFAYNRRRYEARGGRLCRK